MGLIERFPRGSIVVYTSSQGDTHSYDEEWKRNFGVEVIRDRSRVLLPTPRVSRAVNSLVRRGKITQVWFGAAAPLALLAPGLRRHGASRIVALTHGHEVWWAKLPLFSLAMRRIGSSVDHLTYLGEFTRAAIGRSLTSTAENAMVKIAPGIDIDHFKPVDARELRSSLNLSDKKVIVSVGRLVSRKGQDVLIRALPLIAQHIPHVHVLLIGTGPLKKKLVKLIDALGLQDRVTFTGRIHYAELPRYLSASDLFVMPSRSRFFGLEVEGLGIVYLEASAVGLPVVAGNSGGAPDAVKEGITGVVVDGRSESEVARATIQILQDDRLARSMAEAGRRWIVEEWRWQIWSERFNSLLN